MRWRFSKEGNLRWGVVWFLCAAGLAACQASHGDSATAVSEVDVKSDASPAPDVQTEGYAELIPAAPRLPRLTVNQYRNAVSALFGDEIVPSPALEPDFASKGLFAIGASVSAVSPYGVEQYFNSALSIGEQLIETSERRALYVPCTPGGVDDASCLEQTVAQWAPRIYRGPVSAEESSQLVALGLSVAETLGDFYSGVQYVFASMLQSPRFLYRIELGEPDGTGGLRYTNYEMASRLSFFLWNSIPDQELMQAAEAGELVTDEGLRAQVKRMLAASEARGAVRNFFAEWLNLYALDDMDKDPTVFKHFSSDLGEAAREETLRVVEDLVFDKQADYREFFTTTETFVNTRLAAIYNIPAVVGEGFGRTTLPAQGARAGFLGHVSFLALNAHPASSSATLRGVFIRERLLCQEIPSPPTDVDTSIPEPAEDALTLKERLVVHMEDPVCGACHEFIDPPGFGLENFDGIGRYRVLDNGGVIDPSGVLDEVPFDDARDLVKAVSENEGLAPCLVETLYGYATGHARELGERGQIDELTDAFVASGYRVLAAMEAIALSSGFRTLSEVEVSR